MTKPRIVTSARSPPVNASDALVVTPPSGVVEHTPGVVDVHGLVVAVVVTG